MGLADTLDTLAEYLTSSALRPGGNADPMCTGETGLDPPDERLARLMDMLARNARDAVRSSDPGPGWRLTVHVPHGSAGSGFEWTLNVRVVRGAKLETIMA